MIEGVSLTHYFADETRLQDASPQHLHRATFVDGSARAAMPLGMALTANPYEDVWTGQRSVGGIDLVTGSFHPADVDIALPAAGVASWVIGRNYNAVQESDSSHHDADSLQGWNWGQSAMPEIRLYMPTPGTPSSDDKLYLVAGVDRFVEFTRNGTDPEFEARQGAAGVFQHVAGGSGEPDLFVLTDQHGTRYTFFTPDLNDEDAEPAYGQLWTIEDEAGNVAYVGHATDAALALAEGYDATSGAVTTAFDAANRRYTFSYDSGRLEEVEVEVLTGGDWESPSGTETVARVEYAYYGPSENHGSEGDLKSVKVLEPGSGAEGGIVRSSYYRYYTGSYDV